MTNNTIYKIATRDQWNKAEKSGTFSGAPIDHADGYIHFSTAATVTETAAKHFYSQTDLLLVAVDAPALGDDLKFEVSRGGVLFPHLYAELKLEAVLWVQELPIAADGTHIFPVEILEARNAR